MPQLDKLTYFSQFFWFLLFFFTFYILICNNSNGLLGISRILKLRKELISKQGKKIQSQDSNRKEEIFRKGFSTGVSYMYSILLEVSQWCKTIDYLGQSLIFTLISFFADISGLRGIDKNILYLISKSSYNTSASRITLMKNDIMLIHGLHGGQRSIVVPHGESKMVDEWVDSALLDCLQSILGVSAGTHTSTNPPFSPLNPPYRSFSTSANSGVSPITLKDLTERISVLSNNSSFHAYLSDNGINLEKLKRLLLENKYQFTPYTPYPLAEEGESVLRLRRAFPLEHGRNARIAGEFQASDLVVLHALGVCLYKSLRETSMLYKNFFYGRFQSEEFLRTIAGWGPMDSLILWDFHTMLNELDPDIIKMKVEACLFADQAIKNLIYAFIDLPSVSSKHLPFGIRPYLPSGLPLVPSLSLMLFNLALPLDWMVLQQRASFEYARLNYSGICSLKSSTDFDIFKNFFPSLRIRGPDIKMARILPGTPPLPFRNGIISLTRDKVINVNLI